jgi:hypothetical protein
MALLTTVVLTLPLHPMAPRSAGPIAAVLIALATLRIVLRFVPSALAPLPWGLAVLFTIDRARDLLDTTPTLERLVFLGEMVGVLGLLIWLLRPSRVASLPEGQQRHPLVRLLYNAMRAGAGFVILAILADLAGNRPRTLNASRWREELVWHSSVCSASGVNRLGWGVAMENGCQQTML